MQRPILAGLSLVTLVALACGGEDTSLIVDVRSDFVPGVEAVEADLVVETLPDATRSRRALEVGDDLIAGVRVARIGPVPAGSHILRATLKGRGGEELLSRRVAVQAHGATGVVITLTRNCGGVTCPSVGGDPTATECQDGLCVPPACSGDACGMAECALDSECTPPASECAEARCVEGVCLSAARIGACGAGFICVEGTGCVAVPGADGGVDGGVDGSRPDTGAVDTGSSCECTPAQREQVACGVCGTRTRVCGVDCRWGSYAACVDDDARCTGSAGECINDHCWGYRLTGQGALSCIDMDRDYDPSSSSYGVLGEDVLGRPGAMWTKEIQQTSCPGSSYRDAEGGTIDASGTGVYSFSYGASTCTNTILGHWRSRFRIQDTDGSTFYLTGTPEGTFRNSSCSADRQTCSAAATFCPPPTCTGACSAGETQTSNCGTCGTRTRTCRSDCTWGAYSSCTDTDARCTGSADECINDYCWGYRFTGQSLLSCIDMNRDYDPSGSGYGVLGEDVFGRPGAMWTKEIQQTSCPGSSYRDAEGGTIDASGMGVYTFPYGASTCTNTILGHWRSRFRIQDTDGSTFYLTGTPTGTFRNSSCSSDRSTCSAAASYCPP